MITPTGLPGHPFGKVCATGISVSRLTGRTGAWHSGTRGTHSGPPLSAKALVSDGPEEGARYGPARRPPGGEQARDTPWYESGSPR